MKGTVVAELYRIGDLIGQGGMASVYEAEHLTLGIPVALKILHGEATEEVRERFAREAHAASRLAHPNVVRVLDYGATESFQFIAMELLDGEPLATWLWRQTEPPPLSDVRDIIVQVTEAIAAAHAAGVVHRDLKPENVFLVREGDGRRVAKVVDFGLAFIEGLGVDVTLTQPGTIAGTPYYMSPEQCRSLRVGPPADVYALGCMLTELLQLEPPFDGATPAEIMSRQMFAPAPPIARPSGAEAMPARLERLRLDALAKSESSRPQSAAEFRDRLARAFEEELTR